MPDHLPALGEKYYFMHKEVIVLEAWDCFHLVKIKESTSDMAFYVDICTITCMPDITNSISLQLLRSENE